MSVERSCFKNSVREGCYVVLNFLKVAAKAIIGKLEKVMEKIMKGHRISRAQESMNPL